MKIIDPIFRLVSIALVCCLMFTVGMPDRSMADENLQTVEKMMEKNSAHMKSFFSHKQSDAIRNILGAAKAVYLAPEVTTAGFLAGMEMGKGMLLRRHGQEWSDPVFMSLSEYSIGFQAGVKESAIIMLIMTDEAVDNLVNGLQKIGGSGGFALGNLGIGASGAGGIHGGLEILVVTTSQGAFIGTNMSNVNMSEMKEVNQQAYGADHDIKGILSKPGGKLQAAAELRAHLKDAVIKSWAQ